MSNKPAFKRILIKISGEALAGDKKTGINFDIAYGVCSEIKKCLDMGCEIAIVVGAGNFWRGRNGNNMDNTRADHMGMLATMMNALALQDVFIKIGIDARVLAAVDMQQFAEPYIRDRAVNHLEHKRIVIFGCGTGNPFFTTDTAAALRAIEINADIALLAKNVDGVYSEDPNKNPNAVKYKRVTYSQILKDRLTVIDATAAALCQENNMRVMLFALGNGSNIVKILQGDTTVGSLLENE